MAKKSNFKFSEKHVEFFENSSAEYESHLDKVYVENDYFSFALDFGSRKSFFIARTGLGKSAILSQIKNKKEKHKIISINPEDFAPIIYQKSHLLDVLTRKKVNLDLFLKTIWKFIFITEILKRKFGNNRKSWLQKLTMSEGPVKRAYKFLESNEEIGDGSSFADQMKKVLKKLEVSITAKVPGFSVEIDIPNANNAQIDQQRREIQEVLQSFEFHELSYFIDEIKNLLDDDDRFFILIDDLDKTWIETDVGLQFMKNLFLSLMDLSNVENIKVVVALRYNLFQQLSFPQPEKIKPFLVDVSWSDDELKKMLEKRFYHLFDLDPNYVWSSIFPSEIRIAGQSNKNMKMHKYLMLMSNRKPRDLFTFISFLVKYSKNKNAFSQDAFRKSEIEYSTDRLTNFKAEWQSPFHKIDRLIDKFKGSNQHLKGDEIKSIIEDIIVEVHNKIETDFHWVKANRYLNFSEENFENPNGFFNLFFRIGLIGVKDPMTHKINYAFKPGQTQELVLSENTEVYINPAFVGALTGKPFSDSF